MQYTLICKDAGGYNKPSVWDVTLTNNGRSYTVEYTIGCGVRRWKRLFTTSYWAKYIKRGQPVGQLPNLKDCEANLTILQEFDGLTEPIPPTLDDVLDCLVSDAGSVRHGQDFAEWCSEFGYDVDSRKAYKSYKGCIKEWQGLTRLGVDFEQLEAQCQS
jgi:hypothetical protein